MRLIDVYEDLRQCRFIATHASLELLFQLLQERLPEESISHKEMPTWEEHCAFVLSQPYEAWYVIEVDGYQRGAIYLSRQREIGVAILKGQRGHGYALDAVHRLMEHHAGRFLWNANPRNTASIALAKKLGFGPEPLQVTFTKEPE
jgi:RimJ/RimL family protein N-acetyltransferase